MKSAKTPFQLILSLLAVITAIIWTGNSTIGVISNNYPNPLNTNTFELPNYLGQYVNQQKTQLLQARRETQINKVQSYFKLYGSPLVEYASIFVDKSYECGGDYRVLVGIAGSESGLGKINVLKYNPFGYLNGVQYNSQQEALEFLACQVSKQHIAPCGTDLYCLAKRYIGPVDDLELFVSKVRFFYNQVD